MKSDDFFPVGSVIAYAGPLAATDTAPGINLDQIRSNLAKSGWLFCDGSSVPRDAFWQLYGVIGSAFGSQDDNSFNLPDLRGRFVRGVDGNSGNDLALSERTVSAQNGNSGNQVGSLQLDAFQGHEHNYKDVILGPATAQPGEGVPVYVPNSAPTPTTDMDEESPDGKPRISKETRPANLYLNYIIRYC
ncbi:Microcystin-dependent protein [Pseudomonas asplenii]|uniref:Microcystin-dependent protein n=1 Tax=Pseudomonas asplenii TaxID=53407 RepID=A0A1H1VLS9_9PSED|nr:tail fiber protein [Pseudomonas asplenii]SDS85752.1 Microcystin-dependent protein [Pseudomonas asplenii]